MGGSHAKNIGQQEGCEVVAVADVSEETVRRVADESGAKPFTDYKKLLRDGGVDAVMIATPHYFHPPIAEYAAKRGIHVLTEKPIAVSVAAADKMIAVCQESEVLLGVVFQQRTEPSRRAMKRLIDEGVLGKLHRISMTAPWYRPQAYYDSGSWRGTWKGEGGGILMNQAPHSLDQFVWLGGVPQRVQSIASTRLHDIEVENLALAIFDYGDGKIGWLYTSTAELPGGERIEIAGDKGALVWEGGKVRHLQIEQPLSEHLRTSQERFGSIKGEWHDVELADAPNGHMEVVRAFARAVRENNPSLLVANGEDGLHSLEMANAILMAGYKRKEIEFPLDRHKYEKMLKKLQKGEAVS
jgi:predicted dehydrogenase